jgi:hypothetical protein
MWKRLLICFSFATWCFLNTWVELAEGDGPYFARFDPRITVALPALCCEVMLTLLMLAAWEFFRRRRLGPLPHLLFLASCLAPIGIASVALLRLAPVDLVPLVRNRLFWPIALAVALAPAVLALRWPQAASRLARGFFLYSSPVLALILVQAVRHGLWHSGAEYADGQPAARLESAPPVRVIWIVFDELSRKIAFDARPASLTLPNFDRLRAESFDASAAEPPGRATETCMPSLILGEIVSGATPLGPSDLRMNGSARADPFGWNVHSNVFDTARAMGLNTALIGWFHPYGRVLNHSLTEWAWTASQLNSGIEEPATRQSLLANMRFRLQAQMVVFPLVGHIPGYFPGLLWRLEKMERFGYLLSRAEQVVADPSCGLALLHLQEPHPPPVFSRRLHAIAPRARNSYLDSLAFTDQTLGDLRRKMEQAGLWDKTALIISADHGWRNYIWRGTPEWTAEDASLPLDGTIGVPFIVKLPHQTTPLVYSKPFNTVVTRAVITQILEGKLTQPAQLPAAIEQAAKITR